MMTKAPSCVESLHYCTIELRLDEKMTVLAHSSIALNMHWKQIDGWQYLLARTAMLESYGTVAVLTSTTFQPTKAPCSLFSYAVPFATVHMFPTSHDTSMRDR